MLDIRADLEGREKPEESIGVVLVARVGGVEGFTWDPDRAAFTVQDLSAAEHAKPDEPPQHDAEALSVLPSREEEAVGEHRFGAGR